MRMFPLVLDSINGYFGVNVFFSDGCVDGPTYAHHDDYWREDCPTLLGY